MNEQLLEAGTSQNALTVTPQGEREIVMSRAFNARAAIVGGNR